MTQTELMFELSHPARIGLLRLTESRPVRHRDMMQATGLPPSEVTRHARRLIDNGFMRKNRDGCFEITRLGSILLMQLDDFEFIIFHGRYFERHDISDVPQGFDIFSVLRKCQILEETMEVVNSILRVNAESGTYVNCILDEFNDALVSVQADKLRSGVDIRMTTRPGIRVPWEYSDNRQMGIDIRTRPNIPFFHVASEREAIICLKRPGGKVDYSMAFASADEEFLEWCGMLFGHYWAQGRAVRL